MGSKLGIIFAFLLSIAAAGGSYYLYQGWVEERTVRGSVEAKYDQVKEKMTAVQSEKEELASEKEQLQAKSEEYRTKAEAMQSQLGKLQEEQGRIDSEKSQLEEQLKTHQGMIAELQTQVASLAKKAKDAQAACGVTPGDLNTNPFSEAKPFQGVVSSAAPVSTETSSVKEPSQLVFKPVTAGGSAKAPESFVMPTPAPEAPVESTPVVAETPSVIPAEDQGSAVSAPAPKAPAVVPSEPAKTVVAPTVSGAAATGKVLTVNRKFNFVVINQGLQDGLKMGDKLKVLKQGQEIASIQVEKLYDKFSAATLVEENPKQQVVEGDEIRRV